MMKVLLSGNISAREHHLRFSNFLYNCCDQNIIYHFLFGPGLIVKVTMSRQSYTGQSCNKFSLCLITSTSLFPNCIYSIWYNLFVCPLFCELCSNNSSPTVCNHANLPLTMTDSNVPSTFMVIRLFLFTFSINLNLTWSNVVFIPCS